MTLPELFADLATGLNDEGGEAEGEVDVAALSDSVGRRREWRRAGTIYASVDGRAAEFRLDPLIAVAALRTPDTRPSPRGPAWLSFEPDDLDDYALDRAEAWFVAAFRRAAPS